MVMDQSLLPATAGVGQAVRCGYCPKAVVFHPSVYGGHALCFDAAEMPVRADREKTGWLPGGFVIAGQIRVVHAPWHQHGHLARRRAKTVHQLHICSGQTRAVAS